MFCAAVEVDSATEIPLDNPDYEIPMVQSYACESDSTPSIAFHITPFVHDQENTSTVEGPTTEAFVSSSEFLEDSATEEPNVPCTADIPQSQLQLESNNSDNLLVLLKEVQKTGDTERFGVTQSSAKPHVSGKTS